MQVQIVGLERVVAHRFHHRVTAAFDTQTGCAIQLWLRPIQRLRAFGKAGQDIQFAECAGAALEAFQLGAKRVEQAFVQQFFSRDSERSRADSTLSSNVLSSSVM